jgi:WD40 repeat protein
LRADPKGATLRAVPKPLFDFAASFAALVLTIACGSSDHGVPTSTPTKCDNCGTTIDGQAPADFWAAVPACLREVTTIDGTNPYCYSAAWSPTADIALTGVAHEARLLSIDVANGALTQLATYDEQDGNLVLEWEESGKYALSAGSDLRLFAIDANAPSITSLATYSAGTGQIYAAQWSPDFTHALTAAEDGTIRLLDVDPAAPSLTERAIFSGHVGKAFDVSWAPDGKHAVSAGIDKTLRLLAVDTDRGQITELARVTDTDWESAARWGAGTPILSGTWGYRNALQVWSTPDDFSALDKTAEFVGQTPGVQVIEWSHDRTRLIAAEHDDTLHLFSRSGMTLTAIGTLPAHYSGVHSVGWSADGKSLLAASSHGDIVTLVDLTGCD